MCHLQSNLAKTTQKNPENRGQMEAQGSPDVVLDDANMLNQRYTGLLLSGNDSGAAEKNS